MIQTNPIVTPQTDLHIQWMKAAEGIACDGPKILFIIGMMVSMALAQGMI